MHCKTIRQQQIFNNKSNHKNYQKRYIACLRITYICNAFQIDVFIFDLCFSKLIFVHVCMFTFRITKMKPEMHSSNMTTHKMRKIFIWWWISSGHTFSSSFPSTSPVLFVFFIYWFYDRIENQGQIIRAIIYAVFHSILIRKWLYFSISASE